MWILLYFDDNKNNINILNPKSNKFLWIYIYNRWFDISFVIDGLMNELNE